MIVDTDPAAGTTAPSPSSGRSAPAAGAAAILDSITRLADTQVKLWLAQVRRTAGGILLAVLFCIFAVILAIAAAAFLYAGVFHVLTDYLHVPTAWALLIFAGVHGLAAGVLAVLAIHMIKRGAENLTRGEKVMSDIQQLQEERDAALAALRGNVEGLTGMFTDKPAQWVGAHPYVAIAGAAAAGFLAGKFSLPPAPKPRVQHLHMRTRGPSAAAPANGHHRPDNAGMKDWLEILMALAEPLLMAQVSNAVESGEAKVRIADAGTTAGDAFPGSFSAAGSPAQTPVG